MVSNFVHLRSQPSCRTRQLRLRQLSDFSVFDLLELIVRKHAFTLTVIQSQTNSNWCYDSGTAVKLTIETRLLTIFRQNRQVDGFVKFLFLSIHLGLLNRFMWLVSVLFIKCPSILHFLVRSTFDQENQPNNRRGEILGILSRCVRTIDYFPIYSAAT